MRNYNSLFTSGMFDTHFAACFVEIKYSSILCSHTCKVVYATKIMKSITDFYLNSLLTHILLHCVSSVVYKHVVLAFVNGWHSDSHTLCCNLSKSKHYTVLIHLHSGHGIDYRLFLKGLCLPLLAYILFCIPAPV